MRVLKHSISFRNGSVVMRFFFQSLIRLANLSSRKVLSLLPMDICCSKCMRANTGFIILTNLCQLSKAKLSERGIFSVLRICLGR